MPETSKSEHKEWNGFISSMFSSLFWLQENRLSPRNRCMKCNRPKVQTSPFEARCKCAVLVSNDTANSAANKSLTDSNSKHGGSTISIPLDSKTSPITSKISALCNDDSFMKIIIKESSTKNLPILKPPSLEALTSPISRNRSICCNLDEDQASSDILLDENASENTYESVYENVSENTYESVYGDIVSQGNCESCTQTDAVDEDFSLSDNLSSSSSQASEKDVIEINLLSTKSSTSSSEMNGITFEPSVDNVEHYTSSYQCISLPTGEDLMIRHSPLSCDHIYENCCASPSNSSQLILEPSEESPPLTPCESKSVERPTKPQQSRIPVLRTRLVSSPNTEHMATTSTIIKEFNYQQTAANEKQNMPKKLQHSSLPQTAKRSFHSAIPSKQKKKSQSFNNTTSDKTKRGNIKNSKIIGKSDDEDRLSTDNKKLSDTKKKQIYKTNLGLKKHENTNLHATNSIHSKCYDIQTDDYTYNNDRYSEISHGASEYSSSANDNFVDDETILIIETLLPKTNHQQRHYHENDSRGSLSNMQKSSISINSIKSTSKY